jgi:hypothetical protein
MCSLYEDYVRAIFFDHQQFLSDRQQILSDRQQFLSDRHPHDNGAGLCFLLRHHDSEWNTFHHEASRGYLAFSRFHVHGRTFPARHFGRMYNAVFIHLHHSLVFTNVGALPSFLSLARIWGHGWGSLQHLKAIGAHRSRACPGDLNSRFRNTRFSPGGSGIPSLDRIKLPEPTDFCLRPKAPAVDKWTNTPHWVMSCQ